MNCHICRQGSTQPGHTTITLERDDRVVVFRNVPANICDNCGEPFLDGEIAELLEEQAERALKNGKEVQVQPFAA